MDKPKDNTRKRWSVELGKRLREERESAGLGQGELARRLGVSKQLSSFWESGKSELMNYHLAAMKGLGFDTNYILLGVRFPPGQGPNIRLPTYTVPHPNHQEILDIARGKLDPDKISRRRLVVNAAPKRGIAVEVLDGGLEPRIPAGSVLILDQDLKPEIGQIVVVALLRTHEVLARRYKPGRGGKTFTLLSSNELLPDRQVTAEHEPAVIGTLVECVLVGSS